MSIDLSVTSHSLLPPMSQSVTRDIRISPRQTAREIFNSDSLWAAGPLRAWARYWLSPSEGFGGWGETRGFSWGGPWPNHHARGGSHDEALGGRGRGAVAAVRCAPDRVRHVGVE